VAAVLTIIQAWRRAGSPRSEVENIVTYDGMWSDYCRYPLLWLGHPDPATALLLQVRHDPDGDALSGLMTEWHATFGSTPTTVRKAVEMARSNQPNLLDAMREFPVEERGEINRSKLGWLLKKNANRIVKDMKFQHAEADGRTAWRVVKTPPLAPSPAFAPSIEKSVTPPEGGCIGAAAEKISKNDAACGVPLSEWKAAEVNRVLQEQGTSGQPGRIAAETVRHGERNRGEPTRANQQSEHPSRFGGTPK